MIYDFGTVLEPIFDVLTKKKHVIQLPHNWSQDLSMNEFDEKLTVSFFKLGNFNTNYQRNIEKQLIVTEGMKLLKC